MTRLAKRRIARAKGRAEEKRDAAARARAWAEAQLKINSLLIDMQIRTEAEHAICLNNLMSKGYYSL